MGDSNLDLASLIGSRICHDLISPIGAIGNGLELLEMTGGGARGAEMDLIADSARDAGARIRFFRIAYGAGGGQLMAAGEVREILAGTGPGSRIETHWPPDGAAPRAEVRLAFLALQCLETAMPRGGRAEVARNADTWTVTGHSAQISLDPALRDMLGGASGPPAPVTPAPVTPALVQFALLPVVAADQGRAVSVAQADGRIVLSF